MVVMADQEKILERMPYDKDFCFLTCVTEIDNENKKVKGYYVVKLEDCKGHFKNVPVFPGVKKQEALAQLGVFCLRSQPGFHNHLAMFDGEFTGSDQGVVLPEDKLDLELELVAFDERRRGKAHGQAFVKGNKVYEFSFSFKIVAEETLKKLLQFRK